MITIESVDPESRDALPLWPQVSLTAETLTRRLADALALLRLWRLISAKQVQLLPLT
jgi:hypothetical protein